jgi:hypothetical protein
MFIQPGFIYFSILILIICFVMITILIYRFIKNNQVNLGLWAILISCFVLFYLVVAANLFFNSFLLHLIDIYDFITLDMLIEQANTQSIFMFATVSISVFCLMLSVLLLYKARRISRDI